MEKVILPKKKFFQILNSTIVNQIEENRTKLFNANSSLKEDCRKAGAWPYIPTCSRSAVLGFMAIRKWASTRFDKINTFLDAGAGLGNIMLLADMTKLAKHCTGIEFNRPTFDMAQKILHHPNKKFSLIYDDIMTYEHYDKFDMIYYFGPLQSYTLETYFEELVEDRACVGTIIIPEHRHSWMILNDKRFEKIQIAIFIEGERTATRLYSFFVKISNAPRVASELTCKYGGHQRDLLNLPKKYRAIIGDYIEK